MVSAVIQFFPESRAASFTWDPSPDQSTGKVLGYKFYYSTQSFTSLPADVATNPAFKILTTTGVTIDVADLVNGLTYYMAVTAYGTNQESLPSNILAYTPGAVATLSVAITSPATAVNVSSTANVTVTAVASGPNAITKVEFFEGASLLTTKTTAPYSFSTAFAAGTHVLVAKATDSSNATATSTPVTITATPPLNVPPIVAIISPANNTQFSATQSVTLAATAADSDGSVARVEFYDGATLVGTKTAAPFSVTLPTMATGSHIITAKAIDNVGASTTSVALTINVIGSGNSLPTIALADVASGALLSQPVVLTASASDTDGTISSVEFFANDTSIGVATSAPFTISASMISGTYAFKAKATDNQGGTSFSAPITASVKPTPPVNLTVR